MIYFPKFPSSSSSIPIKCIDPCRKSQKNILFIRVDQIRDSIFLQLSEKNLKSIPPISRHLISSKYTGIFILYKDNRGKRKE